MLIIITNSAFSLLIFISFKVLVQGSHLSSQLYTMPDAVENHKVVLMEHELVVDGVTLRETKEMSTVHSDAGGPDQVILVHTRMIGDRAYQVRETKQGDQVIDATVNTTLSEQEVQNFENDWKRMWTPAISDTQAAQEILPALEQQQQKQ